MRAEQIPFVVQMRRVRRRTKVRPRRFHSLAALGALVVASCAMPAAAQQIARPGQVERPRPTTSPTTTTQPDVVNVVGVGQQLQRMPKPPQAIRVDWTALTQSMLQVGDLSAIEIRPPKLPPLDLTTAGTRLLQDIADVRRRAAEASTPQASEGLKSAGKVLAEAIKLLMPKGKAPRPDLQTK